MSDAARPVCWLDGQLVPIEAPVIRADDSAFTEGRGCYTSVRIAAGRPRFVDRHARRLQRGAQDLRLGAIEATAVQRALVELAAAAFPDGEGIVRLQASRDGDGRLHLVGLPRAVGVEKDEWSAITAPFAHGGSPLSRGHKLTNRLILALAADAAEAAGVDEALLFDAADRLVEGYRSNLFVVAGAGELATPGLAQGAVSGIARDLVIERVPGVLQREIHKGELGEASEVIAVNAVRGACPITRLDGGRVGEGRPGPWSARLADALARD
jgi:branched-subunit amino acid aminotransferase/4-amino-4-deoxychorismate lyase